MIDAGVLDGHGVWSYLIIFFVLLTVAIPVVGAFVPAQLLLLGAGFLARLGELGAIRVALVGFAASVMADSIGYALGRRFGTHVFDRLPRGIARGLDRIQAQLSTHLGKSLIAGRYLGGVRALTPPLAGSAGVPRRRFFGWMVLACFLWATSITALGFFFGEGYAQLEGRFGRDALIVLLVAVAIFLAIQRFGRAKRAERDL